MLDSARKRVAEQGQLQFLAERRERLDIPDGCRQRIPRARRSHRKRAVAEDGSTCQRQDQCRRRSRPETCTGQYSHWPVSNSSSNTSKWKKHSEETQTLRAGCSKAEPKIFTKPQTQFPGAQDGQNLICWRWSLPLPTNPVWWGSMNAISSYCSNRPTNTQTDRTNYNNTAPQLARSVTILRSWPDTLCAVWCVWLGNQAV